MNDRDQRMMLSLSRGDDLPERLWAYDDFAAVEEGSADELTAGLTSLGYLRSALRRSRWLWCTIAVAGMLVGFGLHVLKPPAYQASTSILLTQNPDQDPVSAMEDDQTIAQSNPVAQRALRTLGLRQNLSSFVAATTVTIVTDRVLLITVSAPSSVDAVREANALAKAFLQFRKNLLQAQQLGVRTELGQLVTEAKQHIASISKKIGQASTQPSSDAQRAEQHSLQKERAQQQSALTVLEQTIRGDQANTQVVTASMVAGSRVLDAATPLKHSRVKLLLIYVLTGLIAGLVLGIGIVVVRALVSDRLRRRDDVAHALGAPVKLSVGAVRLRYRLTRDRRLAGARDPDIRRIAVHLGSVVPVNSRGAAALVVVPVDELQVAALSLVSLAVSCAQQGMQVIVADLCTGAPAARLLGAREPGIRGVRVHDAELVVAVPDRDDFVPIGPLDRTSRPASSGEPLATAWASADLLLTLASLDPATGGEHLATWATEAVAVVTAGKSSVARVRAIGEMIRLAGMPLVSAVLVGADKDDESLGVIYPQSPQAPADRDLGVVG